MREKKLFYFFSGNLYLDTLQYGGGGDMGPLKLIYFNNDIRENLYIRTTLTHLYINLNSPCNRSL